jgi:NAD(P)H-nitrite reductase large subunit
MNKNNVYADELIVCRCEDITVGEIREAINKGIRTLDGIKRATRAGMGLCQGLTCQRLLEQILLEETGKLDNSLLNKRPPLKPTKIEILVGGTDE